MEFLIGISPCPNDTFIFDALLHQKLETGHLNFRVMMEDVETLNQLALEGVPDICKISYALWPRVSDQYDLLDAGSALGQGVGPLLISKGAAANALLSERIVAIPGEHTTAHLLFSFAYPGHRNKIFLRYDQIEDFVLSGRGEGVIIHENRFTYKEKGLQLMMDLGTYWEQKTGNHIPLGGIIIRKNLSAQWKEKLNEWIRQSIHYSRHNYPDLSEFVKNNAAEMSENIMRRHIDLYVNEFSLSLGEKGRSAVAMLEEVAGRIQSAASK